MSNEPNISKKYSHVWNPSCLIEKIGKEVTDLKDNSLVCYHTININSLELFSKYRNLKSRIHFLFSHSIKTT